MMLCSETIGAGQTAGQILMVFLVFFFSAGYFLFILFVSVTPQLLHPFGMFLFCRIMLRLPDTFVFQFIGQELLFHEIAFVAMRILVFLSVS